MNCGFFLSLLAAVCLPHFIVTASTQAPEIDSPNSLTITVTTASELSTPQLFNKQHAPSPKTWTTPTPLMESNMFTSARETTSSSKSKEETEGASVMTMVTGIKGGTLERMEEINARPKEESLSKNIATAREGNTVSHVTPVTAINEPAQTGLSSDMTLSQSASESSVVNSGTSIMEGDENVSFITSDTLTVVHNVPGLMSNSVTQNPTDSPQTLSVLSTAQSSQALTMLEFSSPLSDSTEMDTVVSSDTLSATLDNAAIAESPTNIFVTVMPATPKASDVTDQSIPASIPHLSQSDLMLPGTSTPTFQAKAETEEPNLTASKSKTELLNSSAWVNFKALNSTLSPSSSAVTSASTGTQSYSVPDNTALKSSSSTFGGSVEKSLSNIRSVTVTNMNTTPKEATSRARVNTESTSSLRPRLHTRFIVSAATTPPPQTASMQSVTYRAPLTDESNDVMIETTTSTPTQAKSEIVIESISTLNKNIVSLITDPVKSSPPVVTAATTTPLHTTTRYTTTPAQTEASLETSTATPLQSMTFTPVTTHLISQQTSGSATSELTAIQPTAEIQSAGWKTIYGTAPTQTTPTMAKGTRFATTEETQTETLIATTRQSTTTPAEMIAFATNPNTIPAKTTSGPSQTASSTSTSESSESSESLASVSTLTLTQGTVFVTDKFSAQSAKVTTLTLSQTRGSTTEATVTQMYSTSAQTEASITTEETDTETTPTVVTPLQTTAGKRTQTNIHATQSTEQTLPEPSSSSPSPELVSQTTSSDSQKSFNPVTAVTEDSTDSSSLQSLFSSHSTLNPAKANTTQQQVDPTSLPEHRGGTVFFRYSPKIAVVRPLVFDYPTVIRTTVSNVVIEEQSEPDQNNK